MQFMLQHVSIPRPPGPESAEIARKFYGGIVGLTEKPVPTSIAHIDLVWFKITAETELHVFAEKDGTVQLGHFCLNVSDVAALRQKLTESGHEPWSPEEIPGRPRFFCRDPFNNTVEFTQIADDYLKYQ